eukprot:15279135-Alexandrium_andersonii.AAC.1
MSGPPPLKSESDLKPVKMERPDDAKSTAAASAASGPPSDLLGKRKLADVEVSSKSGSAASAAGGSVPGTPNSGVAKGAEVAAALVAQQNVQNYDPRSWMQFCRSLEPPGPRKAK